MRTRSTSLDCAASDTAIRKVMIVGSAVLAGLAYHHLSRSRMLRWGITEEEARRPLPGDELVPDPSPGNNSTHAITIDAPPSAVWPWIVQIGHTRAGWYSHEWVERLSGIRYAEGRSATLIHPEFQSLRVGDEIPYSPFNSIPVVAIEPERYLIIGNSVAWVLQDLGDGRTRLIVRTRGHGWFKALFRKIPLLRELGALIDYVIGEPLHHYMEKGMCIGIAKRAERPNDLTERVRHPGKTPSFRGPRGEVVPGSIAEVAYRRLGGLDQWVMIRGESAANPPLIMLHGGPGFSETGLFRYFNAPLEKSFTVVYWDQRGAGKSFDRGIPRSSMTVEQFVSELDELVDAMSERLRKTKVAIFGHSWGSALGVLYAARFPEKVAAYAGSGQIGDWAAAESGSYAFALAEAQRRGNRSAVKKLRAIGPPPYTAKAVFTERTLVSRFEGAMRPRALWKLGRAVLGGHESSILELPRAVRGFRFSMNAMWSEVSRLNLMELAPALQMPAFFLLGRNDHFVPPETSVAYFDALTAPSKKLVWFEAAGHEPFVDEPDKFNAAMAEVVRPALTSNQLGTVGAA